MLGFFVRPLLCWKEL